MGKLLVIEGVDGSGKATQTALLHQALTQLGYTVQRTSFPNYDSPSSSLIKMYLNGEFGENANSVNAFAASAFYAVDRFATFQKEWAQFYEDGGLLLCDRYTTSNMIHQGSKISDVEDRQEYLAWLIELEYERFCLPKPDSVIFLEVPPQISQRLRKQRQDLKRDLAKDIHESNLDYLQKTYEIACQIAREENWHIITCADQGGNLRSIDDIHQEILAHVCQYL